MRYEETLAKKTRPCTGSTADKGLQKPQKGGEQEGLPPETRRDSGENRELKSEARRALRPRGTMAIWYIRAVEKVRSVGNSARVGQGNRRGEGS